MDINNLTAEEWLKTWRLSGLSQQDLARAYGVNYTRLHSKISNATQREVRDIGRQVLKPSPYPVYDKPLETEGDALVLPDPEFPFHHAEFINRALDLADKWRIPNCIIAGDALHFNSISKWEPAWRERPKNGMTEAQEERLLAFSNKIPKRYRDEYIAALTDDPRDAGDNDLANEIEVSKSCLLRLGQQFERCDYVLGNHDGRFLAALNSPIYADSLLDFIGINDPRWRIAPYYFSILQSGGETFRIEHPKSAAQAAPEKLASKFLCHIIAGHSHLLSFKFDQSGSFYAIYAGHTVDERRLPYASQRSNTAPAHVIGAVIVRDGYPHLLHQRTPWELYARM